MANENRKIKENKVAEIKEKMSKAQEVVGGGDADAPDGEFAEIYRILHFFLYKKKSESAKNKIYK